MRTRILAALVATVFVLQVTTTSAHAADRGRFLDSGQPRELINQPVCWPSEEQQDPRFCDYAQRA